MLKTDAAKKFVQANTSALMIDQIAEKLETGIVERFELTFTFRAEAGEVRTAATMHCEGHRLLFDFEKKMIGKRIKAIRPLTEDEMDRECWIGLPPAAIELEDGTVIVPSRDSEGNGPGVMFVYDTPDTISATALITREV